MSRSKLNLAFGARVKSMVAPPAALSIQADGRVYDYACFEAKTGDLAKLLARAFQLAQSKSQNAPARKKTNASLNDGIKTFLAWAADCKPSVQELSPQVLDAYKKHLSVSYKAWTAYTRYSILARCCGILMNAKLIDEFLIHQNISLDAAKAGSSSGNTIATSIDGQSGYGSADDVNEKVLGVMVDGAWNEAFEMLAKIEQGKVWREQAIVMLSKANKSSSKRSISYLVAEDSLDREGCIERVVKNMQMAFGGFSTEWGMAYGFDGSGKVGLGDAVDGLLARARCLGNPINAEEVYGYFHPTKSLAGCVLFLLSAAQINPESAARLRVDCLHSATDSNIVRVSWPKWRAGGEQTSMPFPKGSSHASKTIPNLIERYKLAGQELRALASADMKDHLVIWGRGAVGANSAPSIAIASSIPWVAFIPKLARRIELDGSRDEELKKLALAVLPKVTLSLARTTALNVSGKRLNRDLALLAKMDGRASERPLADHYLNNAQSREDWDGQIRQAQESMVSWARVKPSILPANQAKVAKSLGIDEQTAQALIDDDYNEGMGASFLNDRAIVIDTPINALRIIQWLKKLESSKPKMLRDNPERWYSAFEPQVSLFQEAVLLLSRKSRAAAEKMDREIQLPFPEVV